MCGVFPVAVDLVSRLTHTYTRTTHTHILVPDSAAREVIDAPLPQRDYGPSLPPPPPPPPGGLTIARAPSTSRSSSSSWSLPPLILPRLVLVGPSSPTQRWRVIFLSWVTFRRVRPEVRKHSWRAVERDLPRAGIRQPRRGATTVRLHVPRGSTSACRTDLHVLRPSGEAARVSLGLFKAYYSTRIASTSYVYHIIFSTLAN